MSGHLPQRHLGTPPGVVIHGWEQGRAQAPAPMQPTQRPPHAHLAGLREVPQRALVPAPGRARAPVRGRRWWVWLTAAGPGSRRCRCPRSGGHPTRCCAAYKTEPTTPLQAQFSLPSQPPPSQQRQQTKAPTAATVTPSSLAQGHLSTPAPPPSATHTAPPHTRHLTRCPCRCRCRTSPSRGPVVGWSRPPAPPRGPARHWRHPHRRHWCRTRSPCAVGQRGRRRRRCCCCCWTLGPVRRRCCLPSRWGRACCRWAVRTAAPGWPAAAQLIGRPATVRTCTHRGACVHAAVAGIVMGHRDCSARDTGTA